MTSLVNRQGALPPTVSSRVRAQLELQVCFPASHIQSHTPSARPPRERWRRHVALPAPPAPAPHGIDRRARGAPGNRVVSPGAGGRARRMPSPEGRARVFPCVRECVRKSREKRAIVSM
ncbi:Protein of unknown function [Gryllus bimaculatus]|nr:Protein of unknown function [Gryllus bimaculatus]